MKLEKGESNEKKKYEQFANEDSLVIFYFGQWMDSRYYLKAREQTIFLMLISLNF